MPTGERHGRGSLAALMLAIALLPLGGAIARADQADGVRSDWYFRESLGAIRDWEAILARWDKSKPPQTAPPVFPVPAGGQSVVWPNPIPLLLLPEEDRGLSVRLGMAEGQVDVLRLRNAHPIASETVAPGSGVQGYKHPGGGGKDQ